MDYEQLELFDVSLTTLAKMKENPSYFGFVHELDKEPARQAECVKQYLERGFDYTELMNLDKTIAKFILPRLVEFSKFNNHWCLDDKDDETRKRHYALMIGAFDLLSDDENFYYNNDDLATINFGLELFGKYFLHLWK